MPETDGEFGDDLTPEEEAARIDRTLIPRDWSDLSPFVAAYQFPYWQTQHEYRYFELVQRKQMSGETLWALKDGGHCYNKRTRRWEYEPLPSSRSDEFLNDCRMTLDEARRVLPRLVWEMNQHARRKVARLIRVHRWRETQNARKAAMQEVADTLAAYAKDRR
jgi:hypothetical protein